MGATWHFRSKDSRQFKISWNLIIKNPVWESVLQLNVPSNQRQSCWIRKHFVEVHVQPADDGVADLGSPWSGQVREQSIYFNQRSVQFVADYIWSFVNALVHGIPKRYRAEGSDRQVRKSQFDSVHNGWPKEDTLDIA